MKEVADESCFSGVPPARGSAFTLLELLAAMATIAFLGALLSAGLSRGKERARAAVCGSNLRQLGLAAGMYSLDNKDLLPDFWAWLYVIPGDLPTGTLYPYTQSKAVYLCPTDRSMLPSKRGSSPPPPNSVRGSSYAMNCLLCHQTHTSSFVAPDRTFLLMEPNLAPHDVSGMVGPIPWKDITNNAVSSRHSGSGYQLFCDLHVDKVNTVVAQRLRRSNRFWLAAPTTDTIALGFATNLPDP